MLGILNGLIRFTLFLMGKFNSKFEQIESRTASWNGLCSTFEGPLYSNKKIFFYSVELKNIFIVLLTTSFGRYDHLTASVIQNFKKGWLHVLHKNVKLCWAPFTSMSVFVIFF
jgi:hypothetical protein